ncbi:MAG: SRPBCC family protein [Candidatus Actinomarina sp.]|tara:strand:- start:6432 stop:6878 length:447 start_codon:yes stop_codon:yes gene_type:complete
MSKTISVKTIIDKPLNDVWNEVSVLKNHTNWMQDAVSIEFLNEKTQGLGAEMKVLTKVGPIKLFDYMKVTEWIDKKSIGVDHVGIVTGKGKFTLTEISQDQTEFQWEETLKFPIYLAGPIGEFFGSPILKLIWRNNLKGLKELFKDES